MAKKIYVGKFRIRSSGDLDTDFAEAKIAPILVHDNGRTTAEKGIACPFLTTLNGLQEVGRGAMVYFGKGRDGGVIVREDLSIERN